MGYNVIISEVLNLKKGVLTSFAFSIVAFILSLITIIISINSILNNRNAFVASLSIITNSGLLDSSISIMALILGCCLFIASLFLLKLTFKWMGHRKIS